MVGFHFLVSLLCSTQIKDTQCGFKLFTRHSAFLLFKNVHIQRWAFDVELIYLSNFLNIPISEIPIHWHEVEGSKLSPLWASLEMGRDLFRIRLLYWLGIWKVEFRNLNL